MISSSQRMTFCLRQLLFSSPTKCNAILPFYLQLSAQSALFSLLLPQFTMRNLRLAIVKDLNNLAVVVVAIITRRKPLLLPSGSALLSNHFAALTFTSTLGWFMPSISLPMGRSWSPVVQTNACDCGTFVKSLAAMPIHAQFKWSLNTVTVAS